VSFQNCSFRCVDSSPTLKVDDVTKGQRRDWQGQLKMGVNWAGHPVVKTKSFESRADILTGMRINHR